MSGPRVTSGEDSKQDYATPGDLMAAVAGRFGPMQFDLAAHAGNKKHERYFAPTHFITKGTAEELELKSHVGVLARLIDLPLTSEFIKSAPNAIDQLNRALPQYVTFLKYDKKKGNIFERSVPNVDPKAYAFDAFKHNWSDLSRKFTAPDGGPGLLWLNCEFNDVTPWSARCYEEKARGANITLLTPLTMANWCRDNCLGWSDVYFLSGRVCFDGKNVYPKDTMISHFHAKATGRVCLWDWKADKIYADGTIRPELFAFSQNERKIIGT